VCMYVCVCMCMYICVNIYPQIPVITYLRREVPRMGILYSLVRTFPFGPVDIVLIILK
jgi:hypothetical protein